MIIQRNRTIFLYVALLVVGARLGAQEGASVLAPAKRQDTIDKARKLLLVRDVLPVTIDPFHSEKFAEFVAGPRSNPTAAIVVGVSPRTERETLQAIAMSLKPSGNFVLSGQQTLVFGQKKVKAGGSLTITFEGTEYTLEITAIERTNFTLRLNREEFTRPIK